MRLCACVCIRKMVRCRNYLYSSVREDKDPYKADRNTPEYPTCICTTFEHFEQPDEPLLACFYEAEPKHQNNSSTLSSGGSTCVGDVTQ